MIFTAGGKTDQGLVRAKNEDHIYLNEKLRLAVVADGMGGHTSGETASKLAVKVLCEYFQNDTQAIPHYDSSYSRTTNRMNAAIELANQIVYDAAQNAAGLSGMGTTIAAAMLSGNQLSFAHIGDSRIYLVRSGSIEQLTDDHSFVRQQVKRDMINKEEAEQSVMKNILTRALGISPDTRADLGELTVFPGDILLLCSDGLYNMVSDGEMLEIVSRAGNVHAASDILIDTANDHGGKDNISAIVGYIHQKKWFSFWSRLVNTMLR